MKKILQMTNKSPFSIEDLNLIRNNYAHIEHGHTYLNHAAIGPLSKRIKLALDNFIRERHEGPIENYEHGMEITANTRDLVSGYINSPNSNQISFIGNTSEGISAVAEGLSWKEGDEIILNSMEFPTNVQPFRALAGKGVKIVIIETQNSIISPEQIEDAITSKTRLVSISAVQFLHGFKADLEAIGKLCRKHDLFFVVDAIQCLGALPIDVQKCNIDALASGAHKWLMSPLGTGFLYCSKRLANQMKPPKTGWLSVEEPWELFNYEQNWQPFSQHMEVGTPNMLGITGLGESLQTMFDVGTDKIEKQIQFLTGYLINQLHDQKGVSIISPIENEFRAGIVTFTTQQNNDPDNVINQLKEKKITLSAREGLFRISPHYYNTTEEIDNALGELF